MTSKGQKWGWWRVKDGAWVDKFSELDWLTGELGEMAEEYGVHAPEPIMTKQDGETVLAVYSLQAPLLAQSDWEEIARYRSLRQSDERAAEELLDSWDLRTGMAWLYFFEPVYPSSHLVYVHYGDNVEAYGVFCATWKDMLDVVKAVL